MILYTDKLGYEFSSALETIDRSLSCLEQYKFDSMDARNRINGVQKILDEMEQVINKAEETK